MRTLLATIVMAAGLASAAGAQQNPDVTQFVQDGASVSAYGSFAGGGSYSLNAWSTTRRGADGSAELYVYFSASRQLAPDAYELLYGSGYMSGGVLRVTGNSLHLELPDLMATPGVEVFVTRCTMFLCDEGERPATFPVDVVFTPNTRYSEERQGITRRHQEHTWPSMATIDVVEVGSVSSSNAVVTGLIGDRQVPTNDIWSHASIYTSRGATITIERPTQ